MHPSAFRLPPSALLALILAMGGLPASGQSLLKSHGHNNLPVLQKLTAPGGVLTYDGSAVGGSVTLAGTPDYITISGSTITRAAINLTSHVTGTLPVANGGTGVTALGTGIATALGVNVGSAGAPVLFDGAGGTPSSLTLTNATGLPPAGVTGTAAVLGANTFTALQTITQASANAGILASTGYSLTGTDATSMVNLAGTWNTTGTPTAIKLNITNTASNASSLLMDLQTGGSSRAKIYATGELNISPTATSAITGSIASTASFRIGGASTYVDFCSSTAHAARFYSSNGNNGVGMTLFSSGRVGLRNMNLSDDGSSDVQIGNGTTATNLRVYNTYTSTTNYERATTEWSSNVLKLGTQKGSGGGTARDMIFVTDDTERLRLGATGEFILTSKAAPANASDTGTAGEIRVDASYIYICTATNTWKRVAIATW